MKLLYKLWSSLLVLVFVVGATGSAYAASGRVVYNYSTNHFITFIDEDQGWGTGTMIGVDVTAGATFNYNASDTQSRTYNNEEYWVRVDSSALDYYTSQLSFYMFDLIVYPEQATAKTCSEDYEPSYIISRGYLFFEAVGSNTLLPILKKGNSYGKLTYNIAGGTGGAANSIYFNNLGVAVGTVSATTSPMAVPGEESALALNDITNSSDVEKYVEYFEAKIIEDKNGTDEIVASTNEEIKTILSYAEENNLEVSEEDVNNYIEKLLDSYETSCEHDAIERACEQLGITFEEIVRNDFIRYKVMLTEEKAYEDFKNHYIETHFLHKAKSLDTIEMEIISEWDLYKGNLITTHS